MRKTKEVLRLHFELKLGQRQIARSVNLSQSTVHDYLARFASANLQWPLPEDLTEEALEARMHPAGEKPEEAVASRPLPDYSHIHQELRQHKHTTLQLLWEEYRGCHPDGYSYSRFCHHYEHWKQGQDLVMRQVHKPGEKLFVDWAGTKIPIHDPKTGAVQEASLFVAVMGASNYTYAEATLTQAMEDWIGAHIRSLEFFRGVPELLVPDNTRTGVARPCRYDPDLNPTYQEMAKHYGAGVLPARVRKPRDKAKVEVGVQIAERWILAALRHRRLFSLRETNESILELLDKLNHRPFKKREGTRFGLFGSLDHPALRPLPERRYDQSAWSRATVNIDYHIQFDRCFYSVPYPLARAVVEVRATPATVEIFHKGERVASHARVRKPHTAVTVPEHRPKAHQAHLEWPPSRMVQWAQAVGPHTAQLVEKILDSFPHPEMGYRSCLGIIRLGDRFSTQRVEAAAQRAMATGAIRYKSMRSILQSGLDQQPLPMPDAPRPASGHDNIRGAEYFE